MAKEFHGILLVMAAIILSSRGREILGRNKNFSQEEQLKDWTLLMEI